MPEATVKSRQPSETRQRLLDATRDLVLREGFNATGIDRICATAGVTKGAFFHHFPNKEALGKAALEQWGAFGTALYAAARAEPVVHPLDHLHRFFGIMEGFVREIPAPVSCVVGMISQEMAQVSPALREACHGHLNDWAAFARLLLDEAKARLTPRQPFDSGEVAWFLNCAWQGAMLIGKTQADGTVILHTLRHARAYVDSLFLAEPPPAA